MQASHASCQIECLCNSVKKRCHVRETQHMVLEPLHGAALIRTTCQETLEAPEMLLHLSVHQNLGQEAAGEVLSTERQHGWNVSCEQHLHFCIASVAYQHVTHSRTQHAMTSNTPASQSETHFCRTVRGKGNGITCSMHWPIMSSSNTSVKE